MEKFVAHMLTYCDPHTSRPPDFEGAKLSQIFDLYASIYGNNKVWRRCR